MSVESSIEDQSGNMVHIKLQIDRNVVMDELTTGIGVRDVTMSLDEMRMETRKKIVINY